MLRALFKRRRGLAGVVSLLGVVALMVGMAGPAYAAGSDTGPGGGNNASGNYNIYQGGSNTTYLMMLGLATLFNEAPGCDLSSNASQALDYGCPGINDLGGSLSSTNNPSNTNAPVGEDGFTPFANENPFNDVLIEEPALGSSNGIKELEEQTTHAPAATLTVPDVSVTSGSNVLTAGTTSFSGVALTAGNVVSGTNQGIPSTAVVCASPAPTASSISLCTTTSGGAADNATATGTFSITFSTSASGANVSPLDVARSSRAPNLTVGSSAGDDKGLDFVAYAMDGVSWLHWTKSPAASAAADTAPGATPSAGVTNISIAQLESIFNGTLSCSVGGSTVTMNWECLAGGTAGPIDVYWAQNGSGTEATWANMLYGTTCSTPTACYSGLTASHIIFENETESIIANNDEADAIFFFSYGKYSTVCTPTAGYCGAAPAGWQTGSSLALGNIAGQTLDEASIASQLPGGTNPFTVSDGTLSSGKKAAKLTSGSFPSGVLAGDSISDSANCIASGTTITDVKSATKVKLSTATTCTNASDTYTITPPTPFPGDRLLYNVYSDGTNADIPASSDAALNVVSEDGFLCKPSTATDTDPNTGATYRSEIDNVITSNGFFSLPLEVETGSGSFYTAPSGNGGPYNSGASYNNPAWTLLSNSGYDNTNETGQPYNFPAADTDSDNSAVSGTYGSLTASQNSPVGYCLVLTTDGNSTN